MSQSGRWEYPNTRTLQGGNGAGRSAESCRFAESPSAESGLCVGRVDRRQARSHGRAATMPGAADRAWRWLARWRQHFGSLAIETGGSRRACALGQTSGILHTAWMHFAQVEFERRRNPGHAQCGAADVRYHRVLGDVDCETARSSRPPPWFQPQRCLATRAASTREALLPQEPRT